MAKGFKKKIGNKTRFVPTEKRSKSSISSKDMRYKKSSDKSKKDPDELKLEKQIRENAEEHDVSEDVVRTLQEEQGDDVFIESVEHGEGANGEAIRLELDDSSEWYLFENHDQLRDEAIEDVKQLFDDIGVEGINGYESYVKASDASSVASDLADSRMEGMEDEIRSEIEDEVKDEIEEPEEDDFDDEDDYDTAYNEWEEKVDEEIDRRIEIEMEDKRSDMEKEIEEEIEDDPVGYYINQEGLYSDVKELLDAGIVTVDEDELAEYVVDTDGAEHTVARYDGNSYETDDGQVLVRVN